MTLGHHTLSTHQLTALAQGRGGTLVARRLAAARLSKTSVLVRDILHSTGHMRHEQAELVRQAYSSLARIQRVAPGAVQAVLGYPAVGAWALRCAQALRGRIDSVARPAELAAVAAAAAVRGSVPITISLRPPRDPVVRLPSLGTASWPTAIDDITLRSSSDGASLDVGNGTTIAIPADPNLDGPNWRGIRRISCRAAYRRLDLLLDGSVSRSMPAELAPIPQLTDSADVELWEDRLTAGWRLLTREHTMVADEIAGVIRVIAPLARRPAEPASATLGDAFGCIVMSLPADDVLAAVTLVHETRHAMLTALMDFFPLVEAKSGARFYAPWREDPRPAVGLLHGLYAHLGVAAFWRTHRRGLTLDDDVLRAHIQFARWSAACREVAQTLLDSGLLTSVGQEFVLAMRQQLDHWGGEEVPTRAVVLARQQAEEHRARWIERR